MLDVAEEQHTMDDRSTKSGKPAGGKWVVPRCGREGGCEGSLRGRGGVSFGRGGAGAEGDGTWKRMTTG
jgi:hypothetical protein